MKFISSLALGSWNFCTAAEPELLTEARRALAESIPQIAIRKIEALRADQKLGAEARTAATLVLAEALLDAGRHAEALRAIEPVASMENPAGQLLLAHILAADGRWAEALPIYERLDARLGLAESLQATNRSDDAITVLDKYVRANPRAATARLRLASLLVDARKGDAARDVLATAQVESPGDLLWKKYVEGRLLLLDGKAAEAAVIFEEMTKTETAEDRLNIFRKTCSSPRPWR